MADVTDINKHLYHARTGGSESNPTFCTDVEGHPGHFLPEQAAACLGIDSPGDEGFVYETIDGLFTNRFLSYKRHLSGVKGSLDRNGSPYRHKSRIDI